MSQSLKPPPKSAAVVHAAPAKSNRFPSADDILFFYSQLAKERAAAKAANKALALTRKRFKNTGITLATYDLVERLADLENPEAFDAFLEEFAHISAAFDVPVGTQLGFFDGPKNATSELDHAYQRGLILGKSGRNADHEAYAEGPLWQEHERGWQEGQKVHHDAFLKHNRQAAEEEAARVAKKKEREEKAAARAAKKTPTGETVQ